MTQMMRWIDVTRVIADLCGCDVIVGYALLMAFWRFLRLRSGGLCLLATSAFGQMGGDCRACVFPKAAGQNCGVFLKHGAYFALWIHAGTWYDRSTIGLPY